MQNLFLFHGEDNYSSSQKLRNWQKHFVQKFGDSDLEVLEGKKLDLSNFTTNLEAMPFLSEKRLIILRDFIANNKTEQHERITPLLSKIPDFSVLVFLETGKVDKRLKIYKQINKFGKVEEFTAIEPDKICDWIINKAKSENTPISYKAANYFSQVCPMEMWNINNEYEKLKTFANGEEISTEMVEKVVTPSLTASIFKLTDSMAIKDHRQAIQTLHILKESGEELTRVFYMIVRHFRIMIQIRDMMEKNENQFSMQKKLKQHPFVIKKTAQQARNFNMNKLKDIYTSLLDLDTRFKTGKIKIQKGDDRSYELELEKIILEISN